MSSPTRQMTRVPLWGATAVRRLRDTILCPVCEDRLLQDQRCANCGADFTEGIGVELWDASQAAVAALEARQAVLDRVPLRPLPAPAPPAPGARPAASALPSRARGASATVQSVLAVAGAGLVAVAAIVFAFFNPDLTDHGVRSVVVAATTLVFLGGAVVLVRRGLQFSAEAVGALALVFVALDVQALSELAPASPWILAALGTLLAGAVMLWASLRLRVRVWLWASLLALAFVPAMLGFAGTTSTASVLGWLGAAVAASVLGEACPRLARRFADALRAERVALTLVQLIAGSAASLSQLYTVAEGPTAAWLGLSALLAGLSALALFSTRHIARPLWSFLAGAAGVLAVVALPLALPATAVPFDLQFAFVPAAAVVGLIGLGILLPLPRTVARSHLIAGAVTATALAAFAPTLTAGLMVLAPASSRGGYGASVLDADGAIALVLGLAALAAGLVVFARADAERHAPPSAEHAQPGQLGTRWLGDLGLWYAALAGLALMSNPGLPLWGRIATGLGLAAAVTAALVGVRRLRTARIAARLPLLAGTHAAVLLAALTSWRDDSLVVGAGIAIVATVTLVARAVPASVRFLHTAVGYAYALVVLATALAQWGVEPLPLVCLTTSAGALVTVGATFLDSVPPRSWRAILAVTSVPFVLGVVQVLFERSGWTALSTGLIFLLALTLVVTKRPGLGIPIRALAGAILVPSLAVVAVCLGAQVLAASGSPVVLPVVAVLCAATLAATPLIRTALAPRIGEQDASLVRLAIESSTLLTAALAVVLALVRDAAGLGTTLVVLVVLGAGAVATAAWAGRRYGWWLAGAAFTGALWCVWGLTGVEGVEPYLVPPALGAAVVGAILTARGARGVALYATGLAAAVVPIVVLFAVAGPAPRGYGLVAASWLLVALGAALGRGSSTRADRLRALRPATFATAIAAAAAGAALGARFGLGLDGAMPPVVVACALAGLAGAVPSGLAARALRAEARPGTRLARSRWLAAPALLTAAAATWPAIHRDWFAIWTMWALMLALLCVVAGIALRSRGRATSLPPAWFVFGLAFATAVVAWSPRELRVEWFSLPLGLFLLAAGALHLRRTDAAASPSLASWPAGFAGSWPLLAPGVVVTLSASVAATFTDPLTWRAILVIVLALAAILVGARHRLAAPFLIGVVALPVENALAFLVQIGRGIQSMPWWITLAVVGAVLLIIAVTYERRAGEDAGIAARLRDLT